MAALDSTADGRTLASAPQRTALYRHFDEKGELLYVGISLNAARRLAQHGHHSSWFSKVASVRIEWHDSRAEALAAERLAIVSERPAYNTQHGEAALTHLDALALAADRSRAYLVENVVAYRPAYTLREVAKLLGVTLPAVQRAIDAGRLGYIDMPTTTKPQRMVSGWQLIDFIESLQQRP